MDPQEAALWPIIRDNAVQVVLLLQSSGEDSPISSDSPKSEGSSCGSGTIIYGNEGNILIVTCGHNVLECFTDNAPVRVSFSNNNADRLFHGVSSDIYDANVITDQFDAEHEVAILYVKAPFEKVGARFRQRPTENGLRIMMCSNTYSHQRFSHVVGHISSRFVSGAMVGHEDLSSLVEYVLATGRGSSYDLSGCLVAVHTHVKFIMCGCRDKDCAYPGRISRGIPIEAVISTIRKLCNKYSLPAHDDPYEMLDNVCKSYVKVQPTPILDK
ncbi:hypothetical protein OROGR_008520 [Orobanche gracilis]